MSLNAAQLQEARARQKGQQTELASLRAARATLDSMSHDFEFLARVLGSREQLAHLAVNIFCSFFRSTRTAPDAVQQLGAGFAGLGLRGAARGVPVPPHTSTPTVQESVTLAYQAAQQLSLRQHIRAELSALLLQRQQQQPPSVTISPGELLEVEAAVERLLCVVAALTGSATEATPSSAAAPPVNDMPRPLLAASVQQMLGVYDGATMQQLVAGLSGPGMALS
jgi:hypothetical protein